MIGPQYLKSLRPNDRIWQIMIDALWRDKNSGVKATDEEVIAADEETVLNKYFSPEHLDLLEVYCVGGRGDIADTHVMELLITDPAIPGVQLFDDQTIIW